MTSLISTLFLGALGVPALIYLVSFWKERGTISTIFFGLCLNTYIFLVIEVINSVKNRSSEDIFAIISKDSLKRIGIYLLLIIVFTVLSVVTSKKKKD